MNRRKLVGGLLVALVAPAVVRSGVLMPVSTLALPTYGPGGVLTRSMIAAEFNRKLQNLVAVGFNRGQMQSGVDFSLRESDVRLSLEEFSQRFLDPAAHNMAGRIGSGALAIGMQVMPPFAWTSHEDCRNGVFARVSAHDIFGGRGVFMRLDVIHS